MYYPISEGGKDVAHRRNKSVQPPYHPGQSYYPPEYGPPWENHFHEMYLNGPFGPTPPYAPYQYYFPSQHPAHFQPCFYCPYGYNRGPQPYFGHQQQDPHQHQYHQPKQNNRQTAQPQNRYHKPKDLANSDQTATETINEGQRPFPAYKPKVREK